MLQEYAIVTHEGYNLSCRVRIMSNCSYEQARNFAKRIDPIFGSAVPIKEWEQIEKKLNKIKIRSK